MPLTRTMAATETDAFDHLMKNVLNWDQNTAGLKSLMSEGYTDIVDIIFDLLSVKIYATEGRCYCSTK